MKFLIVFLLFIPLIAFSQQVKNKRFWDVTISDVRTGKEISGATMSIGNKNNFIADSSGHIAIDKTYINLSDALTLSCVGFQSKIFIVDKGFTYPDSIKLSPDSITLHEVVVKSPKQLKMGDVKKSYNTHSHLNPNTLYIQYIPNEKGISGIITTIEYFVNDTRKGIERPFKVGLYSKDKNDLFPDQKLLNDSVIVFNSTKKKKIVVDVSKYNISFPKDGVMVAFETLCPEVYGGDQYWDRGWLYSKVPGIDMDLKEKRSFLSDREKTNRITPYALVMDSTADGRFTVEDTRDHSFVYADGNNFAILITVER